MGKIKLIRGSRDTPGYPKGFVYFVVDGKIIDKKDAEALLAHIQLCEDLFDQL